MSKVMLDPTPNARLLFPLPVLLVSCSDGRGNPNVITISAASLMCADPFVLGIAVSPRRYSYELIKESGQFVVNVPDEDLLSQADYCGTNSGRKVNKFDACGFTAGPGEKVNAPLIEQCPVNIECEVTDIMPLGSHDWFTARALVIHIDERLFDKDKQRLKGDIFDSPVFLSGHYRSLGKTIGSMGFASEKPANSLPAVKMPPGANI